MKNYSRFNHDQSLRPDGKHQQHLAKIKQWASASGVEEESDKASSGYFPTASKGYLQTLIPVGKRVLVLGSGDGSTLAFLKPSFGLGVEINTKIFQQASRNYPLLSFIEGDIENLATQRSIEKSAPFDFILLEGTLGYLSDIQEFLAGVLKLCSPHSRVISVYYGYLWEPAIWLAENLGLKQRSFDTTWLRMQDVQNFFTLSGFQVVRKEWRILVPFRLFGLGPLINRYLAPLPLVRKLCIRHFIVARPFPSSTESTDAEKSVSVIVPCRNEKGNIRSALERMPKLGSHTELIFVEGHSQDGTWEEIQEATQKPYGFDIKSLRQSGEGKGDAVRAGMAIATGDIVMILDADLTVPPEDLPKFYDAINQGKGEFINGSRLIYGMEGKAMRLLNYIANHSFAYIFTYLLNQRLTDTLCGTKVLTRESYQQIDENREQFGLIDPFGDFDLIFGAAQLNLKIVEIPIRYASRSYGTTQISRFRHGLLLVKMVFFAFRKFKAI